MKVNTKLAIQDSFRRLLRSKTLDRITVRDIVEDCGLTRNTFYYYYEDIYDLFDDYLDTQMQLVLAQLPEEGPWEDALLRLMAVLIDSPRTGRHIFCSKKRDTLRQYLSRFLATVLERYIAQQEEAVTLSADDRRLICDACSHAIYGLLEQWVTGPDAPLLQEQLRRVTCCFDGTIRHALRYCAEHPRKKEKPYEA